MDLQRLRSYLDDPQQAAEWLRPLGVRDVPRAQRNLVHIAQQGVTLDLLLVMAGQLTTALPTLSDPDMALNNLERFVAAQRSPLSLASLFERDPAALGILLQIFSTSQHLSDQLVSDPESYDLLRMTEGQPVQRQVLVDELLAEVGAVRDEATVMRLLRRFKRRETLRIGYGDIVRGQRLSTVTEQISFLAEALVEAAVFFARRNLEGKRGVPRAADGRPIRFCVLGMGKLGGIELNYSSDIDLIFLYDQDGRTDGPRPQSAAEFFTRLGCDALRLLTEPTDLGIAWRVDMRLRPEGQHGPLAVSTDAALHYYDVMGRTWERQAFIKARPVAGDLDFGQEILRTLQPWVYRRYLSGADISGIKALKRKIEDRVRREGEDELNVKTGRGGIRDIEFVIQFLQLLHGGDLEQVRTSNTLEAIARLGAVGCLTHEERARLHENYVFLRRIEHLLQLMFDLQTHRQPVEPAQQRRLALRMGFRDGPQQSAEDAFSQEYRRRTGQNRQILDHLLHNAFPDDAGAEPEVDLILDPAPSPQRIDEVLQAYGFEDPQRAWQSLVGLGTESVSLLNTRRCRHMLAAILPQLLSAIAATPDPMSALINLQQVSDSLGGKGVLWEMFRFNPPSLRLYVELCAYSPFLSQMLITNPGMIDELMDSLVLNRLPDREFLQDYLEDLSRGAEDLDPILHSFKRGQVLRVGVRDLLGKEDMQATMGALSDIADTCLGKVTRVEYQRLVARLGEPVAGDDEERPGRPVEPIILGLGKLGGRELNYHSDLDVMFLYAAEGSTRHPPRVRHGQTTTNQHFYSELGQRVIKTCGHLGPYGRLYEVDPRLRPTGRSGPLATSLPAFRRYFLEGEAQLWERQTLCRARVVYAATEDAQRTMHTVAECIDCRPWEPANAEEIYQMRLRLEQAAPRGNLKRGEGGIVDIEFLVQMLQLRWGREHPQIRTPNTQAALARLHEAGLLDDADFDSLTRSYRFLRTLEGRLRLSNPTAHDALPEEPLELEKLARQLGHESGPALRSTCEQSRRENRRRFERLFDEYRRGR